MKIGRRTKKITLHHAIGIDISDGSLELINISEYQEGNLSIDEHARVTLPDHTIIHGAISDKKSLDHAFDELIRKAQLEKKEVNAVISALPDSQVLLKTIPLSNIPHDTTLKYLDSIARDAFQELNVNIEKPVIQWRYIPKNRDGGQELILYIANQQLVNEWRDYFERHHMHLVGLEMESLAVARSLIQRSARDEITVIIDFGYRETNLSVIDETGLRYSHSIDQGGFTITHTVAEKLNKTAEGAEKLVRTVGTNVKANKDVGSIIRLLVKGIAQLFSEGLPKEYSKPKKIIVTGGGALIPGVKNIIEEIFGVKTVSVSPWILANKQKNIHLKHTKLNKNDHHLYTGAIGLALRGTNLSSSWKSINFIS